MIRRQQSIAITSSLMATAAAFALPSSLSAQRTPAPDTARHAPPIPSAAMIQQQLDAMTPMFGAATQATFEAMLRVLERKETAERLAGFTRNYYEALLEKGFSTDEALRLTIAAGFPHPGGVR